MANTPAASPTVSSTVGLKNMVIAPLTVDTERCVGCKLCMKVGCPAISITGGKARIDATLCTGCGVCSRWAWGI